MRRMETELNGYAGLKLGLGVTPTLQNIVYTNTYVDRSSLVQNCLKMCRRATLGVSNV